MAGADEPGAAPGITIIPAPAPVPAERARADWPRLAAVPELACAPAWSAAARAWWHDAADARLRDKALGSLFLADGELATWLGHRLDREHLLRAHGHVTSTRAGVERDVSQRHLGTGGLRTGPVLAEHRGGARTVFTAPEEVPALVARLGAAFEALPEHPFVRAAWLTQAVGAVHPFRDNNGGTSRFLASLELARAGLPALELSVAQRNGPYMDALVHANRTGELAPLACIVHDVVQEGLASALLAGTGGHASWDDRARARAEGWTEVVDAAWRAAVGAPLAPGLRRERIDAPAVATTVSAELARRGARWPVAPAPAGACWTLPEPLPSRLVLALAPLRGGPGTWLVATVVASVGDDGELAAMAPGEPVASTFVAAADEPDAVADARFRRWLDGRVAQCARGLAAWM